jgi:hypothetical protein
MKEAGSMMAVATLALWATACGGGGGAGGTGGANGGPGTGGAHGGAGSGGSGAAGEDVYGASGSQGSALCGSGFANRIYGGGGGGAEGLIQIRTLDGTFTPDPSFIIGCSATAPSGTPRYTHTKIVLR